EEGGQRLRGEDRRRRAAGGYTAFHRTVHGAVSPPEHAWRLVGRSWTSAADRDALPANSRRRHAGRRALRRLAETRTRIEGPRSVLRLGALPCRRVRHARALQDAGGGTRPE